MNSLFGFRINAKNKTIYKTHPEMFWHKYLSLFIFDFYKYILAGIIDFIIKRSSQWQTMLNAMLIVTSAN